ncbi:unnamed protein product [Ceutorhynchus assimilis]|uniref:Syndecan n=1 Tax=Ceutorhynchus assimilis TaxID=467358 RepID=A0A9N9QI68_9CUCU|nr:unnamed protein product [Ceutorhynchus assimilis]
MHFRVYTALCCALLIALTSAAQNNQRSNGGFVFKDADAEIEGSGFDGEVNRDLESSGSGQGPPEDDDDGLDPISDPDPNKPEKQPPIVETIPKKNDISPDFTAPIPPGKDKESVGIESTEDNSVIMNPKQEDRPTSFFSQPGILAAVIGGAVVGLLCAILVVMFIVYRMRKKDEGSYALGEPKQSPNSNSYSRGTNKEFYA